jgi:2-methylcitrate dehydratase PrpD
MSDGRSLLERAIDYAQRLRFDEIDEEARRIAGWLVFDSIGTGLGGYQTARGRKGEAYAGSVMAGSAATLFGSGRRVTAEGAAFGNGTMMKVLGMDDSHRTAGHIAAEVIPAVLAVAEERGTQGRTVVEAIVAAYDVAVPLGIAIRHNTRARGHDLKGVVGPVAAALAAGLCAGLDRRALLDAVGIAADMASGTEQYVYEDGPCDTKDLIAGFAARNGVFAVQLAEAGFAGPNGALDGAYGFLRAYGDGAEGDALAGLGDGFAITSTAFKPHGGCRHTHQAVDAVQRLQAEHTVDPEAIERVRISTYRYALQPSFRVDADPGSRDVAGLSIRVATAIALTQGSAWPSDYQHWDDPTVRRLRRATDIEVDPEVERDHPARNGGTVEITLRDGTRLEGSVPYAKGEPEFRMTEDEMIAKFDALTSELLPEGRGAELYERCSRLERVGDMGLLLNLAGVEAERAAGD